MLILQPIRPLHCSSFPIQTHNNRTQQKNHPQSPLIPKPSEFSAAPQPFDGIPHGDTFGWNSLIGTHLADGNSIDALLVYHQMLIRGVRPDNHTLPRVLTACCLGGNPFDGRQVHGHVLKFGFASDEYVITSLMKMYARIDSVDAARKIFDRSSRRNPVSWTLLASLYSMGEKDNLALQVFWRMVDSGVEFDSVMLVMALKACGRLRSIREGRKVHEMAKKSGLEFDILVGNSILKMYLECRVLKDSRAFFDRMTMKDIVTWTILIAGYVQTGGFNVGLKLFREMCFGGIKPDSFTVSAVLPACARISAGKHGKEVHAYIVRHKKTINVTVGNALIDMYVKSGCLKSASLIFENMTEKDTISFTVMIMGYSLHGQGKLGVQLFKAMEKHPGVFPDQTLYSAVLHSCNTACLVKEGRFLFNCLKKPEVEHFALMVSLLSRARMFDEARAFIEEHQVGQLSEVHRALLSGCRIHRNVNMGKRIVEKLIEMESLNAENYVMLSNIYAANAKWDMVDTFRQTIRDMGLKTKKALSWIEFHRKIHVFGVGDVSHPRSERIYWELKGLMMKMEEESYLRDDDFSLHDVDEERECIPYGHSEMLAITFGLISLQGSTTIRVTKNLRACKNCHSLAKNFSKIVGREIVLRDPNCFHHFKDGLCSCNDMW